MIVCLPLHMSICIYTHTYARQLHMEAILPALSTVLFIVWRHQGKAVLHTSDYCKDLILLPLK